MALQVQLLEYDVCRRLWRECIVTKKAIARIVQVNVAKCCIFCLSSFITKFEGVPLIGVLKLGWVVSDFAMLYLGNGAR